MAETRNIVILGASYAGLGSAHYFLKHVYPHLPTDSKVKYQVVLVDASSKWFMRHASPRAVASSKLMPDERIYYDIAPGYKQYGDKIKVVQAKATHWDDKARTVKLQKPDGSEETIPYWALVLATGTKTHSQLFSSFGTPHTDNQAAFRAVHDQLSSAKSIVIAGGGPAGVETAGELGDMLNGSAGWFSSRPSNPKAKITLITSSSKLLPVLRQSISDQAEKYLNRVGVDVRYNTKISSTRTTSTGKTSVMLHDGEEIDADIYIAAIGVQPLSDYVPSHLRDQRGYVIQNNKTLRVDSAGPRVYAVGDIGTYSDKGIFAIMNGVPVMETNLKRDLLAAHSDPNKKPEGKDREYKPIEKEMQIVPVGPDKGVGAVFGWRVPSWFVWMLKGRDFMSGDGYKRVDGQAWAKESEWKQ